MVGHKKSSEVDGFNLVRAVRHVQDQGKVRPEPAPTPASDPPPKKPGGTPARVRQTAVPTKTEVVCYECGYTFPIAGKVQTLYCPKCRTILEKMDVTIDTDHAEPIKTTGVVTIGPAGRLHDTEAMARDIVIHGQVERAVVHGYQRVVLGDGARVSWDCLKTPLLVIAAGADIRYEHRCAAEALEVAGIFTATIEAKRVVVKAGGHLRGVVSTPHLIVEEGGGLTARLQVDPSTEPPPEPKKKTPTRRAAS